MASQSPRLAFDKLVSQVWAFILPEPPHPMSTINTARCSQLPLSPMNPPSGRIRKRRAPQRQLPDPHQIVSVLRRRSFQTQSRQRSVKMPRILRSYYKSQNPHEQQPTDPQTSQPVGQISLTREPTSSPIEVLVPVSSRAQFQEYLCPPQTYNRQTRKREPDRTIENCSERPSKRAHLTERNLKMHTKLEKMKRRRKESKRSRSEPKSSRSESKSFQTDETKSSSETVSTTDSRFPSLAYANGIVQEPFAKAPANLKFHQDRIDRLRDTPSPTESEYKVAAHRLVLAENEGTIADETSKFFKDYRVMGYRRATNLPFKDFPKNVGFNDRLSAARPDMVEGLEMPEFDPFPVYNQLGGAAVPCSSTGAITLPHLAGEWKGPGKDMSLARLQAAYDGAHMVYGRNEARSSLGNPDPPGHAFVSTFTTDGTNLNTYAHYSSQSEGRVEYHQYPTSTSLLRSSYEDFKTARRRLRNEQDYARENSEMLRDELKEKWSASQQYIHDEDEEDEDDYDDQEDKADGPSSQLLTEFYTSFTGTGDEDEDEDESFVQIPTPDASLATSSKRPLTRYSLARPVTKLRRSEKSKGTSKSSKASPDTEWNEWEWNESIGCQYRSRRRNGEWEYEYDR